MYHLIERARPGVLVSGIYVGGGSFAADMRWLAWRGFRAVTLRRVEEARRGRSLLRRRVTCGLTRAQVKRGLAAGRQLAAHAMHDPYLSTRVDASDDLSGVARKLAALHVSGAS